MSLFDSTGYYRLISEQYDPDRALSLGDDNPPKQLYMSKLEKNYTSTNWQLFYQKGIYFIRNHDHNLTYHLGVDDSTSATPTMLQASTHIGQQWLIDTWSDDNSTYKLVNRLEPNLFLGVVDYTQVNIWDVGHGAHWTILENYHMGSVTSDMLQPYSVLDEDPTATNPATTPSPTQTDNFFVPGEWLPIDKAGIAIGVIVVFSAAALIFLWWKRSKKHAAKRGPIIVPGSRRSFRHNGAGHGHAEVVSEPPPAYNARPNATFGNQDPSVHPEFGGYYARSTIRAKDVDERSIELPPYGSPSTEGRSFV